VDDGDAELIVPHINYPDRIIRIRPLRIGRALENGLDIFTADENAILGRLRQRGERCSRKRENQDLQSYFPHEFLLDSLKNKNAKHGQVPS
jgi:hypothetical protein